MATVPVPIEPLLLVRNSATVSREIAGETIVVPICAGVGDMEAVYTFNELGGQLWRLLEESRATQDLVDWVIQHFDVSPGAAAADVHAFLNDLMEIGLIQTVGLYGESSGKEAQSTKPSFATR
ncbi:MAG: PqqD family protein [Candidatus Acidiferrum sp.]